MSSTTWPRSGKSFPITNDDLFLEYDENLLKRTRFVSFNGPLEIERTGICFQPLFDDIINRFWGLMLANKEVCPTEPTPFQLYDVFVRVDGDALFGRSREDISSLLVDALLKPKPTVLGFLKPEDFPYSFPVNFGPNPLSLSEPTSTISRSSGRSAIAAVSYIKNLNAFNTRSIGQLISLELPKLAKGGFGISLATRDTVINSNEMEPVFVERIMPTGAAIQDGRLQFGDRLLSINGSQVTTFNEAMKTLRSLPIGEKATLVFSRQNSVVGPVTVASQNANDSQTEIVLNDKFDMAPDLVCKRPIIRTLVFEIPVLHSHTDTLGLGIRFEEWTEPRVLHPLNDTEVHESNYMVGDVQNDDNGELFGLFVKHIVPGSPADSVFAVGSIQLGDRLVAVNGQSVSGLSLNEITIKLKEAISKTQTRSLRKNKQMLLKLSMNRFFHQTNKISAKHDVSSTTESTLRTVEEAIRSHKISQHSYPSAEEQSKNVCRVTNADTDALEAQLSPASQMCPTDLRGRSRRSMDSSSPTAAVASPNYQSSAFTRDSIGRRSVSEKRHAHMSAANFSHYIENVLPVRSNAQEQESRFYSTMPASQKIRQIRRFKQGRSSGPVKPVHTPEVAISLNPGESCLSPAAPPQPASKLPVTDIGDVVCADAEEMKPMCDPPLPPRSRPQNYSFRSAVTTERLHRTPSLKSSSNMPDSPPVPIRRSKAPSSAIDSAKSPTQTPSAEVQNKHLQDFMQVYPSGKKEAQSHSSLSRHFSTGSHDRGLPKSAAGKSSSRAVILTDVRHLRSDLRRTPSPVEFNAYVSEQESNGFHPQPSISHQPQKSARSSSFLEKVETCLPKGRIARTHDGHLADDASKRDPLPPSHGGGVPQASMTWESIAAPLLVRRTESTAGGHSLQKSGFKDVVSHSKDGTGRLPMHPTRFHSFKEYSQPEAQFSSPHAVVRSLSPPPIVYNAQSTGVRQRPSNSNPSGQQTRHPKSVHRPIEKSRILKSDPCADGTVIHRESLRKPLPLLLSTAKKPNFSYGVRDNRMHRSASRSRRTHHQGQAPDAGPPKSTRPPFEATELRPTPSIRRRIPPDYRTPASNCHEV